MIATPPPLVVLWSPLVAVEPLATPLPTAEPLVGAPDETLASTTLPPEVVPVAETPLVGEPELPWHCGYTGHV